MKWNEIKSCRNLFQEEKISAQTQGMKKQNHEIFGVFQNLEKIFSQNIFSKKKKIFEMKYILRIFIPDFGKPQKFHDFVFSSPEFERSCFGREFVEIVFFSFPKVCREKVFFKFHFLRTPSKTFPSIYFQTSPNPIPDQSQSHQSLPLKTKIQFYQNFLPAKRSANHSMFFRRL